MTNQIGSSSALTSQLSTQFAAISLNDTGSIFTLIKNRNTTEIQSLARQNKLSLTEKNSENHSAFEEIYQTFGEKFAISLLNDQLFLTQGFELIELLMQNKNCAAITTSLLSKAISSHLRWIELPENKFKLFTLAIAQKNEEAAQLCVLTLCANTIYDSTHGKTLLMLAAEAGFKKCIRMILLGGAQLDATDNAHKPAWLYLLTYEKSFLQELEKLTSIKRVGTSLLVRQLLMEKQHDLAEHFIKNLFTRTESENPEWWKNKAQRASLLGWALETGALKVAALLKESATLNIHIESLGRKTPLMLAAKAKQPELVLEFVRRGALLTPKDISNTSGIEYIISLGAEITHAALLAIPTSNKTVVFEFLEFLLQKELFKELDDFLTHNLCAHQPKWLSDLGEAGLAELLPFFMSCNNQEFSLSIIRNTNVRRLEANHTHDPLLIALNKNLDDIVLLLVSKGFLLVSENPFRQSGWEAIEEHYRQHPSSIENILTALPLKEKATEHLIHFLIKNNNFARIASLHSRIESLSETDRPTWWTSNTKTSIFFQAAASRCQGLCSLLLNDINLQSKDTSCGNTPLMAVALNGWKTMVASCIQRGATLAECDSFKKTVCACLKEISEPFLYEQIDTLLARGAITADTMTFFIHHSISEETPDGAVALYIARKLLAVMESDQPSWWKSNKEQFLATACSYGFKDFVFLLHGSQDIDAPIGETQKTLLELTSLNHSFNNAVYAKNKQFLQFLLEHNASILKPNRNGQSCWDQVREGLAPLDFVSVIPLSSKELVDFLHTCIKKNDWDAFFALIERCRASPPSWWTTASIHSALETAIIPHIAILTKKEETLTLLLNLSWKQAVLWYVHTTKETLFTSASKNTLQAVFENIPLDNTKTFELLCFLIYKQPQCAEQLLKLLSSQPPSWLDNEDACAELFCWAASSSNRSLANQFLTKININFFKRVDTITLNPFLCAATNGWYEEASAIAIRGAKLTYTDARNLTGYDWLVNTNNSLALRFLNMLSQSSVARFIAETPLTEDKNIRLLFNHCIPSHPDVLLQLVTRLVTEKLSWWANNIDIPSTVFGEAVKQDWKDIAYTLIPSLYHPTQTIHYGAKNNKTALMLAAEKKWEREVIAFVRYGFSLTSEDDKKRPEWKYIEKNFSIEFLDNLIAKHLKLDQSSESIVTLVHSWFTSKRSVLAKTLITRVKNLPIEQQPAWFKDRTICATLLSLAISHSKKPIALLLLNHASLNTLSPAFNNKSPLALAIDQGWEDVVEQLIALDAPLALPSADKKDWMRLTEKFDKPFFQKMILKVPMSSENSYYCLVHLIRANSEITEFFLDTARQKNAPWYADKKKMAYLFKWTAYAENKSLCKKIIALIDVNFVDPDEGGNNSTPLIYAAKAHWDDIVIALIAMNAKLHAVDKSGKTAFEHIQQNCTSTTYTKILTELNIDNSDTYYLLLTLVKRSHTDATTLFTQVLSKTGLRWWNRTTATELFFTALQHLPVFVPRLIPHIDVTKTDSSHKNRSPLMLALEHNLAAEHVVRLVEMGSSFAHKDSHNMSALEMILRRNALLPTHPALLAFLQRCGVSSTLARSCSNGEALLRKLRTETHAPLTRIILDLLFHEMDPLRKYFSSLSSPSERIDLISKIGSILGQQAAEKIIDLAFQIDPRHYAIAIASQNIPTKATSMNIERALLSLYEQYGELKTACREENLRRFASKVVQRVAYIGTPPEKSKALEDFYVTIDNATCGAIQAMNNAIAGMEKEGGKPFLTLVKEGFAGTEKLYADIQAFLKELADAAPNCGGRLMNTAVQQYSYIVHNQIADIRTALLMHAAELRAYIATSLFPVDEHSVHAHTLFLQRFGKRYNIPGASFLEGFNDIFSHSRETLVTQAEGKFLKDYSPLHIVQYIRATLRENPYHGQFMSLIPDLMPESWQAAKAKEIIEELSKHFGSTITSENKSAIQKYLAQEPFVMTITNTEVESYTTLLAAIVKNDLLPIALNRDGKSFSFASILLALVKLNILK